MEIRRERKCTLGCATSVYVTEWASRGGASSSSELVREERNEKEKRKNRGRTGPANSATTPPRGRKANETDRDGLSVPSLRVSAIVVILATPALPKLKQLFVFSFSVFQLCDSCFVRCHFTFSFQLLVLLRCDILVVSFHRLIPTQQNCVPHHPTWQPADHERSTIGFSSKLKHGHRSSR